jgi:hypothetical protein
LRPAKANPDLSLVEHLARFKGVEFSSRPVHCPPRT